MKEKKLKTGIRGGEKFAFLLANIGNIPVQLLIGSFLLIFYTDVCGINAMAIGTLFLVTKLLDGVNDPIMGFLIDHLKPGKLGRFRPCLLFGSIICGLNFLLLWVGPAFAPDALKLGIAYISYILIGFTFDLMDIPLNSMIPVMTDNMKERNVLSLIKGAGYLFGGMAFSITAPLIISSQKDPLIGYVILIVVATAAIIGLTTIGVLGIKERIKPIKDEKYKLKQLLSLFALSPVLILFISTLLQGIGFNAASSSNTFFATYIMGDLNVLSLMGLFQMLGMIPSMIIAPLLANKIGKRLIYGGGLCIYGVTMLIRLFDVSNLPLFYISSFFVGVGTGIMMTVLYGMQADNVDYVEIKKEIRAEGALASLNSFITKAGSGLGGALPAYILAATGYAANATQTQSAQGGIIFSAIVLPGILALIAGAIMLFFYPINNQKLLEMEATLNSRRAEAAKQ